jgi:hypothetical protein
VSVSATRSPGLYTFIASVFFSACLTTISINLPYVSFSRISSATITYSSTLTFFVTLLALPELLHCSRTLVHSPQLLLGSCSALCGEDRLAGSDEFRKKGFVCDDSEGGVVWDVVELDGKGGIRSGVSIRVGRGLREGVFEEGTYNQSINRE